jgi:[acyl-carrier-protein] S-malonyltransferase
MGSTAIIFPGQGAQKVGMGRDVAEISTVAAETFAQAGEVLGFDLAALCYEGPAERLEATDVQQPAIFVTSVALYRAWVEAVGEPTPAAAAGLSLGEYTALHVAGSFGFADALKLVQRRGELMQEAAEAVPGGMASVMQLSESEVDAICAEASRDGEVVTPANFNCPGQIVLSGHAGACDRAAALVDQHGGRAIVLQVAGAFHSPLMQPAADKLTEALAEVEIREPKFPVIANVDAEAHGNPERIRDALTRQVTSPVRWQLSIERLIDQGVGTFVEVGPGRVLTGLMRRIDRKAKAINVSTAAALNEAVPA